MRPGDQVAPVQVVARTSRQQGYTIVRADEILGVDAEEVKKYLLVEEGAAVQREKPLLRKSGLFGGTKFTSPVNGILQQVRNGRLILQHTPDLFELRAMMEGTVHSVLLNRGVVIETQGSLIQARWSSGREGHGRIDVAAAEADEALREEHVGMEARGAILVAGRVDRVDVLAKAEENSVRGVVVGSVAGRLVDELPNFRFPILVTDGFAGQPMAAPIFRLLQQSQDREASLFGRMENGRPEIVIPLPASPREETPSPAVQPVEEGQQVRILRAPHAGRVGKIVAVHSRAQTTAVGLRLGGADVALEDGTVVFVPFNNLDLLI
ncbi:MAG: KOW motif-containing protein [Candidatus Promineifilaceae bacterium]|nr:KOW motif-containing protein [Candidatus Promineifilaceae bacterium]